MEYNIKEFVLSFGNINEKIDEDDLNDILDELDTMKLHLFELAIASIELGKPQILEYILHINKSFTQSQINDLKKHVEEYVKHETKTRNIENVAHIIKHFEKSIGSYIRTKKKR
jgi:hypothetical protein